MVDLPIHTPRTVPEETRHLLNGILDTSGRFPNLEGVMAGSPPLLEAYLKLGALFDRSSLSAAEQAVVLLTVSRFHESTYCVAAQSAAAAAKKVPREITDAIREDRRIPAARFEALRQLTEQLVARRGGPDPLVIDSFFAAGYTTGQLLEVVLGAGLKTLSDYTALLAGTPVDEALSPYAWEPPSQAPLVCCR